MCRGEREKGDEKRKRKEKMTVLKTLYPKTVKEENEINNCSDNNINNNSITNNKSDLMNDYG